MTSRNSTGRWSAIREACGSGRWPGTAGPARREWALAWDGGAGQAGLFGPALLEDADTFVLAGRAAGGRLVAGAAASRSDQVVGVSNLFARGDGETAWTGVLAVVDRMFPGLPVVGYEYGEGLAVAEEAGFEPIGPLRVWAHRR